MENSASAPVQNGDHEHSLQGSPARIAGTFRNWEYDFGRAKDLSERWFNDPAARTEVIEVLGEFKLDESAIEAEAIRISSASLEGIDRMLAAAESRRSRAFRNIEDCRASFAKTIRTVSDRALQEGTEPLTLQPQE